MERKIGEVFEFEGKKIRVEESKSSGCDGCFFSGHCHLVRQKVIGYCQFDYRTDDKDVIFVEITEEQQEQTEQQTEQPQKLNLCEVLKYCPEGETFWSPMLGDVKLYYIDPEVKLVTVTVTNGKTWDINADATISIGGVRSPEIMLYPSREQRDWTKVKYEPKKELPKTWEEFCQQNQTLKLEYYIDGSSCVMKANTDGNIRHEAYDRNILPSKQAAEAHLALMQLHQLRDCWREGWVPDWNYGGQIKYVITPDKGELMILEYHTISRFLAFQDMKRADEFRNCFIDLIKQAGDLI